MTPHNLPNDNPMTRQNAS